MAVYCEWHLFVNPHISYRNATFSIRATTQIYVYSPILLLCPLASRTIHIWCILCVHVHSSYRCIHMKSNSSCSHSCSCWYMPKFLSTEPYRVLVPNTYVKFWIFEHKYYYIFRFRSKSFPTVLWIWSSKAKDGMDHVEEKTVFLVSL